MIPALPCGSFSDSDIPAGAFYVAAFEDGDTPHCIDQYRIETVIRALKALQAHGHVDVEIGSLVCRDLTHLLLIGLVGEVRNTDRRMGCVAVLPVGVD